MEELAYPMGSIKLLGIAPADKLDDLQQRLLSSQQALMDDGVFTPSTVIECDKFPDDVRIGMQAMAGAFFRPNLLVLELPKSKETHESLTRVMQEMQEARRQRMGVALLVQHDTAGLGRRQRVNLWIPDQSPDWKMADSTGIYVRIFWEKTDVAKIVQMHHPFGYDTKRRRGWILCNDAGMFNATVRKFSPASQLSTDRDRFVRRSAASNIMTSGTTPGKSDCALTK